MGEKGTKGYEAMKRGLLPPQTEPQPHPMLHGEKAIEHPWQFDNNDPDRAFNPGTGQNAVWDDQKQQWTDAKTGAVLGGGSGLSVVK